MQKEEYWLQQAKALPYGGKAKIQCCGSTPSMIINHSSKGYSGWCFRCSPDEGSKFHPHGELSIKQILARREAVQELSRSPVVLPRDFSTEIPDTGRVWLLKAGISAQLSSLYGIGYSEYYRRVIIPVLRDGELDAFIARSVTGETPKYIARMRNPDNALFLSNIGFKDRSEESKAVHGAFDIVLTEDIPSAIRTGRHCQAGAVLGTTVSDAGLQRIDKACARSQSPTTNSLEWWRPQDNAIRIAVWLDPDAAGRKGSSRIANRLRLSGRNVVEIRTNKDPKYLSDRQIIDTLKEYRNA